MANTYDFLGDIKDYWMKSSLQVYTDLAGTLQYVGKTENEKTFSPNIEIVEWKDNTSGTQTLYILDIDAMDVNIGFMFKQVVEPNVLALAFNGELDTSDPNFDRVFLGSAPNALAEAKWIFTGSSRAGLSISLVMRKGITTIDGDWTIGTPGEYTGIPVRTRALQDTTITNGLRDLAYFEIEKRALS